jgi:transcription initiation factor TFIIB
MKTQIIQDQPIKYEVNTDQFLLDKKLSCFKCGSTKIIRDLDIGEDVCGECGLVLSDEMFNLGPEWRAFNIQEESTRSRASGVNSSLIDNSPPTKFVGMRDGVGKLLDAKTLAHMNRLKAYDSRSKRDDTQVRNLNIAMAELDRLSSLLYLPDVVKSQAAQIYRKALENDLIRGRSIDSFVAASIYAACRLQKVPRSLKTISGESSRDHLDVARTYRILVRLLKIRIPVDESNKFITGIASQLQLDPSTERRAVEILSGAKEQGGLLGKDPRGLAAAALYIACLEKNYKKKQKEFAQAAGTSEVTLRNRRKGLNELLFGDLALSSSPVQLDLERD